MSFLCEEKVSWKFRLDWERSGVAPRLVRIPQRYSYTFFPELC